MARLIRAAEAAKIQLPDHPYATVREEFTATKGGKPLHLEAELSREQFEQMMVEPLLAGTLDSVRQALRESRLDARALDEVLPVGGSTRIPRVRQLVAEELGCEPRRDIHPDLAVALGAAVQAAAIAGASVNAVLVDVCPHSLGIKVHAIRAGIDHHDRFAVLIPRNTAIPASRLSAFTASIPTRTRFGWRSTRASRRWPHATNSWASLCSPACRRPRMAASAICSSPSTMATVRAGARPCARRHE